MPQGTSMDGITEAQYIEFRAFCDAGGNVADLWKGNLRHANSQDVFSPRVTTIVETVRGIATNYPGEGIVIMSASLLLLDVVAEALARTASTNALFNFSVNEANGTQGVQDRTRIIRNFNDSTGTRVLLVTAGVGGGVL
ncbi:unnamed protein product [Clonostachys byssicola]|uniref:Uncharacterized protein n=1 Tax=Clonostachys byssicola TaxID=160290 RepID=A0A9N9XUK6_9HYPO|nr:unnamed protein product [Clonostachys byssicola]